MGLSLFPPAIGVLNDLSSYFAAFVSVSSFCDHVLIILDYFSYLDSSGFNKQTHQTHKDAEMLSFHVGLMYADSFLFSALILIPKQKLLLHKQNIYTQSNWGYTYLFMQGLHLSVCHT